MREMHLRPWLDIWLKSMEEFSCVQTHGTMKLPKPRGPSAAACPTLWQAGWPSRYRRWICRPTSWQNDISSKLSLSCSTFVNNVRLSLSRISPRFVAKLPQVCQAIDDWLQRLGHRELAIKLPSDDKRADDTDFWEDAEKLPQA